MGRYRTTLDEQCRGRYLRKEIRNSETGGICTQRDMAAYALARAIERGTDETMFYYTLVLETIVRAENDKPVTWLKAKIYTDVLNEMREAQGLSPVSQEDMGFTYSTKRNQVHSSPSR